LPLLLVIILSNIQQKLAPFAGEQSKRDEANLTAQGHMRAAEGMAQTLLVRTCLRKRCRQSVARSVSLPIHESTRHGRATGKQFSTGLVLANRTDASRIRSLCNVSL